MPTSKKLPDEPIAAAPPSKRSHKRAAILLASAIGVAAVVKKKRTKGSPVADVNLQEVPNNAAAERARLLADATEAGVDLDAAVDVAEKLGRTMPQELADRYVDRRIATGYTPAEAESILINDLPDPTSDPHHSAHENPPSR